LGQLSSSRGRVLWLKEGDKGTVPIAFHFQFRPEPFAD
jgi:hypothetical protein